MLCQGRLDREAEGRGRLSGACIQADLSGSQGYLTVEWVALGGWKCLPLKKGWIQPKAGEATSGDAMERMP